MKRIREIQLAAQGSQREQLLLERVLRLYEQENGLRREVLMRLIEWFRLAGWQDSPVERESLQANGGTVGPTGGVAG